MKASIQIDTKGFGQELQRYMTVARKDAATVLNTKAFFVTLEALKRTPKVKSSVITRELLRPGKPKLAEPHGRRGTKHRRTSVRLRPSFANLLVNAARRRAGEKALAGAALAEATRRLIGRRKRSRAFLASGWLPALRDLSRFVDPGQVYRKRGAARSDVVQFGPDKGSAMAADAGRQGANLVAVIVNSVEPRRTAEAAFGIMQRALQEAMAKEVASMREYFDRKMQERAKEFNGKSGA